MPETSNPDDRSGFEQQLDTMHQQHLRQDLEDRLEDLADDMEETVLQAIIARDFLELDVAISDDAKAKVKEAKEYADNREIEALDEIIDDLEDQVNEEARTVENTIQDERSDERDRVTAMRELNEHVEAADAGKLEALETLLSDWNWKAQVYTDDVGDSFEAKQQSAHEFAQTMSSSLTEVREALLGNYSETTLAPVINQLLGDDPLHYTDLTEEEKEALDGSKLADYVELRLG